MSLAVIKTVTAAGMADLVTGTAGKKVWLFTARMQKCSQNKKEYVLLILNIKPLRVI